MEAIPSASGESPAADGIFFAIAYVGEHFPTLLGLKLFAWVTAGEQRCLFLFMNLK